ncbi:MAG: ATP-binding cassette domain-containing protein, partial [Kiloniellales bacterium]|nr:ATP-binding cassette domain-containing protein [Kiloniellales bacterium]
LMVLLRRRGGRFVFFDGASAQTYDEELPNMGGTVYFAQRDESKAGKLRNAARAGVWFQTVAERFRGLVGQMLAISMVSNLLALAVPLFIMAVYDKVIGARDPAALYYLFGGIVFALLVDCAIRTIRARILAYVAGRIDTMVGCSTFQQILHLSVSVTERASIGAQIAHLRQFESIREFFAGPLASAFLDLPFVLVFFFVIALIGGPIIWIPAVLAGIFVMLALLILPLLRRSVREASEARAQKENFLIEMLSELRAIKMSVAEALWLERFRELSARSALAAYKMGRISTTVQSLAQSLMLLGGIATITFGTLLAMEGEISIGALIASMALVWRILSPLQLAFLSFTRIEQVGQGLRQINHLMRQRVEREPNLIVQRHRRFEGDIRFERVSLRYLARAEPALLSVNATIKPGQVVAIAGPNGSGKSSLLRLIAGIYEAQAGGVFLDGIDTRHLDKDELRGAIAYVPQNCDLFHGTIAQNLRLSNPTASEAELAQAAVDAGLLEEIMNLPEGFETRLTDQLQKQLPGGIRQRLMLARAYVKNAGIFLMDEPANNLDREGDEQLIRKIQKLRGHATVVLVTHRPSHMRIADQVFYLEEGRLMLSGEPQQVLPQIGLGS